ncbi:serine/threonine-protein phosphatase 4 regulatory subunit 3A isoform X1 [Myzus persicae]|uniref:serine/threonine-protein phosphatase 4 regulatory subunit 3A isoform X1 n=1 Tax=Myzus persicae TaxID=13164 RepID=UPI000B937311|nr:serine/threonine-protein phosphatase 4 regulatory subunit 3A isoform X1 [Myzus persicae]
MFDAMTDTKRRVKLYALNADRQWDDRGTGHVSCTYVERLKGVSLLVRAEADGALLLESKIQHDTVYQKQQDTLIVWSEADNFDLALSFQEKAGCEEIWEKICSVQGKDPTIETTQDIVEESEDERFDDLSDSAPPVELPLCEIGRLKEIKDLFITCMATPLNKDRLAEAIENDGYVRKLVKLFNLCEDLNNLEGLHCLYDIVKNIFLINKNALFEMLFADDIIFDVIGCLEYDPTLPIRKYHRHHLKNVSKFKEVILITNLELLNKIHQTHRVQYIQDVVLPTPSVFEDNMLSALSSFIFFNKVEIVTLIQEDEKFLPDLLGQLQDESTPDSRKLELVQFLKEFCNFSQNLQPPQKEGFFRTLTSLGILPMLEMTLMSEDVNIKQAAIDILTILVEFSPSVIREYILQQSSDTVTQANGNEVELMLMNVIIEQMICDTDPDLGRAVQLMGVIRVLIDPENMLPSLSKVEKTDFLNYFYKHSVQILIAPLLANTVDGEPARDDYQNAQLLAHILELLTFCVEHHAYHIKTCILNKDLLKRVLVLMKSAHKFLVLGALRFMRKIVALKDEFYNRYIMKGCLFGPVIDCLLDNNGRYNLLDSAIIELFEFIKLEDIKILIAHVVENYGKKFEHIDYVQTFKALRIRHSQQTEKLKEKPITNCSVTVSTGRFRRDPRQIEDEEEIWFNNEDDEFDDGEAVVPHPGMTGSTEITASEQLESIGKSIDKKCEGSSTKIFGTTVKTTPIMNNNLAATPTLSSSPEDSKNSSLLKKALVDYEGDSDEEEDENGDLKSPTKRPRYT